MSYPLRKPGQDRRRVPTPIAEGQPAHPGPPNASNNGRRRRLLLIAGTTTVVAVVVILISVLVLKSSSGDSTSGSSASGQRISTTEDWYSSVCKPGTFRDGNGGNILPSSIAGTATCTSAATMQQVAIGTYSSAFKLQNDATRWAGYATLPTTDGNTEVFVVISTDQAAVSALNPLTQFGFVVHHPAR